MLSEGTGREGGPDDADGADGESSLADLRSGYLALQVRSAPAVAGAVALGVLHLVPPLAPISAAVGVVAVPLFLLGHAIALRILLVNPSRRTFRGSRSRRIVTRWSCRFFFVAVVPSAYGTLLVPGLGLVVAPASFYAVNWAIYRYLRWHHTRHERGQGIHPVEKVALVLVAFLALAGLVLALTLAAAAGLLVEWLQG